MRQVGMWIAMDVLTDQERQLVGVLARSWGEKGEQECTMVENEKKKPRQNRHPIIHCPTSEGVSEGSERANN